jgi:hypothetical protein
MPDINRNLFPEFDPMTELQDWSSISPGLKFRIEDAKTGVAIFGATGSGKSSGPGKHIASAYLAHGFGGLVLCAKPEEAETWRKWGADYGRSGDLCFLDITGKHRFGFLDWEVGQAAFAGGFTMNVVALLDEIVGGIARSAGKSAEGGGDGKFFEDSLHDMNFSIVDLLLFAGLPPSLPLMAATVNTAPLSLEEAQSDRFLNGSTECAALLRRGDELTSAPGADPEARMDFEQCRTYWLVEFPKLSEKTRSIITLSFSMMARPFLTRPLRKSFSTDITVKPEDTFGGKIIIADFSTQEFRMAGRIAQLVLKYCFQIAVLRRKQAPEGKHLRPVFLWWDEAQNFVTKFDAEWHAVARSAAGCSVMLVQTREALRSVLGNNDAVDALLANLQLKFFCQSSSIDTNEFASRLIGERWTDKATTNVHGQQGTGGVSVSEQRQRWVEPSRFTTLRRGGPRNNYRVQAICYNGGNEFARPGKNGETTSTPCEIFTFDQRQ